MGNSLPHASGSQLTLMLDPGLSTRHRSLRSCMAAGVYATGLDRIASKIDMSPSKLCEKLAGGVGDRKRDIGLDEFERYLDSTGDRTPVFYLIDKYLSDPAAHQAALDARAVALIEQLQATLGQRSGGTRKK